MLYQLPTGKTIDISFEHWLTLTDEELQSIIASDSGVMIPSPFFESVIRKRTSTVPEVEDTSIDYTPETDEIVVDQSVTIPEDEAITELPIIENPESE